MGLGVFQSPAGEVTQKAVQCALEEGYRHIDTAMIYRNEADVGKALAASGFPREEVFITTKLWNGDQGRRHTLKACKASLDRLRLDYVDLYLMHWPVEGLRIESWNSMEKLLEEGRCRSIGVSNFMVRHLEELFRNSNIVPAVNQIEMSPYNYVQRLETIRLCQEKGIIVEAYSPLTKAIKLTDPRLLGIAGRYDKTAAQLLIRWSLQKNFVVLPKSVRRERILENADVFGFSISDADMEILDGFNENLATGWDPTDAS